ncbi:acyl--CoA ligase [Streptomyces sp. PTM05]|uniref:Acyl--CoA ligase n=1 Tax=Streptantibioticus parmotrematis TaxID=2873249 RepID=A0ABS7QWG8_9ACTN|nr:class I adenylate-forming enzyme family protein [Streptantibioticus parmotrematis]MBY8886127.1 acyl--CoA ligase [Streptantibioticus parmotrematis]
MPSPGAGFHDLVPARLRRAWAARGHCPDLGLYALFRAHRCSGPGAAAVIDAEGVVGYADLDDRVRRLAAGLARRGVRPGEVVGVQLPNSRDAVAADLAVAALGAVALPFPAGRGAREAAFLLGRSGAVAVIAATEHRGERHAEELAALRSELPALRTVVAVGDTPVPPGCLPLGELLSHDDAFAPARPDPDAAARILVSSGSEAEPKMIAYSHNALAGGRGNFLARLLPDGTRPRCLFLTPLGSAFGSSGTAVTLARHGGTLILLDHFTPEAALEAMRAHRPTHVLGVPTMIRMMLAALDGTRDAPRGTTALVLGGSALDDATRDEAAAVFGCAVVNLYGSADGVNCHSGLAGRSHDRGAAGVAVGRPDPAVCDLRLDPAAGGDSVAGTGEILARGPMTPLCYVGAPELDARYRTPDGWVRTGDLGAFDLDGTLRVVGRLKDVVIRGGLNISPAEVERELATHPAVRDVVCVGVPDPMMGERLAACVVPRKGEQPTLDGLRAHLRARGLERHKHPEHLIALPGLALTPAGKPDRATIRALAARAVSAATSG